MINLIIGQPGGGKSYEAVAFHVLPALKKGRKVITNLPLNVEAFRALDESFPALLDLRQDNHEEEIEVRRWNLFHRKFDVDKVKHIRRPFASIIDYGDLWRHPESGSGPLYVIDECHLCLPRAKPGTAKEVEEWFSLHRHELADVLLITQSYGKVCKAICDMVQVLYRVKKATAFGTNDRYIRKVQDGIGGEVVNTNLRAYEPRYFGLYKSHTKSSEAGQELAANDIVPFWKRWPMIGAAMCFLILVVMLLSGISLNPMKQVHASTEHVGKVSKLDQVPPESIPVQVSDVPSGFQVLEPAKPVSQVTGKTASHPFDGLTIHIVGYIASETRWQYGFHASQNGQPSFSLSQSHLEKSGYHIERLSDCSARIHYGEDISFYAVCDSARVGLASGIPGNG